MEIESTEWGFVPSSDAVADALDALWAPRIEWGMDDPEEAAGPDEGADHVSVWQL